MKEEKQKNWTQIDAFDEFHLMTVTEYNEHGGCVSNSSSSYGFDNSPSYKKSDIDLRIKFYKQYAGNPGQLLKDYVGLEDVYLKKHQMYSDWLFVFCFGDMTEDFKTKIEKLEEKKI